jgi:hypothetical protein
MAERTHSWSRTGTIVAHGTNVRNITAAMAVVMIHVDLSTAKVIGASTVAEIATTKTGVVVLKNAATSQGTTMIGTQTGGMAAATMALLVSAAVVAVVAVPNLVKTLWLNFPPREFGYQI